MYNDKKRAEVSEVRRCQSEEKRSSGQDSAVPVRRMRVPVSVPETPSEVG